MDSEVEAMAAMPIEALEEFMFCNLPLIDFETTHTFIEGMYIREILMPTNSIVTSKIHLFENPYVILEGKAKVCDNQLELYTVSAGDRGITKANTRRALFIEETCKWVTFHSLTPEEEEIRRSGELEEMLVMLVEERIFEEPVLTGDPSVRVHDLHLELSDRSRQCQLG